MSGSYTTILEVKKWLNSQHILVPIEWVESCIDFVREEYHDPNMPLQQLKTCVYEQWLVADLEEIGIPALPPDLCTVQKMVLPSLYVLQLNGIRDIGKPAYSQLRQLEGSLNADSEVTATPKTSQPEWESKPTRMLLLNLTDGVNFIQGMEYKPITSLSPTLPPGLKILVKGPVDCRLGIIMLTQETIKILGGEVENHLLKYSREEMLRESLHLHSGNSNTVDSGLADLENATINSNHQNADSFSTSDTLSRSSPPGRNPIVTNQSRHGQSQTTVSNYVMPSREIDIDNFEYDDDDFVENIDHEALDEIERISSQQVPSHNDNHSEVSEDEEMLQDAYAFQDHMDSVPEDILCEESNISPNDPSQLFDEMASKAPFTYLSSIVGKVEKDSEHSITIKGFISKVLTRLSCTSNKEWQLSAKVNDGTACIEASFHDKVLEELIGISAKDTMEMQIRAPGDPDIKKKISEAVSGCKQKLQELNCLMEIKFVPGQLPCVVKCTQVEKHHIEQLLNRVQA